MVVEGYLEPRRDSETGHVFIAVVATAIQSMLCRNAHELEQLQQDLEQAREAFKCAKEAAVDQETLQEKAAVFIRANESLQKFLEKHPELAGRK
jgi:Tfp pilus assembly protein PilO